MKLAELEKATTEELRRRVDELFADADAAQYIPHRDIRFAEVRFYLGEIERREHDKISSRDYLMELVVICLIALELVVAVGLAGWGGRQQSKEVGQQLAAFEKMQTVLSQLQESSAATAQTLKSQQLTMQSMNDRLAVELGRMSQITIDFSLSGTKATVSNQGNVDLQFGGFKVADMPARINKRPALLKRSASIEVDGIASDIHKASKGDLVEVYLLDDFNNEYVAEGHMQIGPNIQGYGNRLQVVQRRWSSR
jgi:hypothetical protein